MSTILYQPRWTSPYRCRSCTTDAHELSALTRVLLGDATPALAAAPKTMVCSGCSATIPTASANITGEGMQCDLCWRQQQSKQIAQFESSTNNTATAVIAAGLLGALIGGAATARRS